MDNYIGRMLDNRYEILEVIGIGGMAVVYKARCHRLNRLVAIKILKDEFSQDAEFRRRFHAESQAVAMLSHPNIVSVYDVSHSGDTDYIVMELIDGITLKQYLEQKGQLNWREVLHFSTQIAKALEHAHSRGIIHRDIKPHNIMILKDGSVKVADFGIARITSAQSTLTREALGSVHYISPEQARGSRVDKRTDLYSLGVVMYEMLTGRPPFDGDSPVAVAIQHINGTPVLPTEINPSIPKGLEQITMHAMTASLDQRYESATDMLYDLEEFRKNPNVVFDFSAPAVSEPTHVMEPLGDVVPEPAPAAPARTSTPASRAQQRQSKVEKQQKEPGNKAMVIAGVLGILLVVSGIFYFLYSYFLSDMFQKTEEIVLENYVGQDYTLIDFDAVDLVFAPEWHASDTVPQNQIYDQSPAGGTTVKVGSTVTLMISSGDDEDSDILMPGGLVGKSSSHADSILRGMGFVPQISLQYDDEVEKDVVISTDPEEGEKLEPGQTVILTVSNGPEEEKVKVPTLTGLTLEEALKKLEDAGFTEKPNVTYVPDDTMPKDFVTYQSIDQGTEVAKDTVINLLVSEGKGEDQPSDEDPDNPNGEDPNTSDENTGETNQPSGGETELREKIIENVPLPQDREQTVVTVSVDGVPYGDPYKVDTSQGTVSIVVKGTGVQSVSIYFDGIWYETQMIDFGA